MPMPEPKGMSLLRVWIELALSVVIVIPFFLRLSFMSTFLSWIGRNLKVLLDEWGGLGIIVTGFAIALICLAVIAIHECGHMLIGMALGFRCKSLRVGRFKIDRGFRISRHRDSGDAILGYAEMIPRRWHNIRTRMTFMLLAGPIASLLSGCAVLLLLPSQTLISGSFVGISFFFGVSSLLPLGMQGYLADGTQVWMTWFRPAWTERHLALLKLTAEIDGDVPLQSLASADVERATRLTDESADTVRAHTLAYFIAYAQSDDIKAGQSLETSLRYSSCSAPSAREMLALQAAIFQASRRGRIDLARLWLADVPETTQFLDLRSKIQAAIRGS
jgi:hypothetical protein